MTTELADLVKRYDEAYAARRELKKSSIIASVFLRLDRLDQSIADLSEEAKRTLRESELANRERKMCDSSRGRKSSKNRRVNRAADAHRQVMERLRAAQAERKSREDELDAITEWQEASKEYYAARHLLFLAITEREAGDDDWSARKQSYLSAAGLELAPSEVWHDATSMAPYVVNLYYGGVGVPDGVGHGHVILERDSKGVYKVTWHRPAVKEALVFS